MNERLCRYCGAPIPEKAPASRVYCSDNCRRDYQNERRREERAEARALREAESGSWIDPWARSDLDEWSEEEIYANALLDPVPVTEEADVLAGPLVSARPGKVERGWKKNWLRLC